MKEDLTFEKAMSRIEIIIDELSSGEAPLEKSLELYSESAELMAFCSKTLNSAKLTIEEVFSKISKEDE